MIKQLRQNSGHGKQIWEEAAFAVGMRDKCIAAVYLRQGCWKAKHTMICSKCS